MVALMKQGDQLPVLVAYLIMVFGMGIPIWLYLTKSSQSSLPVVNDMKNVNLIVLPMDIHLYLTNPMPEKKFLFYMELDDNLALKGFVHQHSNAPFLQVSNSSELILKDEKIKANFYTMHLFEGLPFYESLTSEPYDLWTKERDIYACMLDAALPVTQNDLIKFCIPLVKKLLLNDPLQANDFQLLPKPKTRITFTTLLLDDQDHITRLCRESFEREFKRLLNFIAPLSQFEIDFEIRAGFDLITPHHLPTFNTETGAFTVDPSHLLNAHIKSRLVQDEFIESDLGHQSISFVLMQVPEGWKPLSFLNAHSINEPFYSVLFPNWGGLVIINDERINSDRIMRSFMRHLMQLYGLHSSQTIKQIDLDKILIKAIFKYKQEAFDVLRKLSILQKTKGKRVTVSQTISSKAHQIYQILLNSNSFVDLESMFWTLQETYFDAERLFHDETLVIDRYFSPQHHMNIYSPFMLPLCLILFVNAAKFYKNYRRRRSVNPIQ